MKFIIIAPLRIHDIEYQTIRRRLKEKALNKRGLFLIAYEISWLYANRRLFPVDYHILLLIGQAARFRHAPGCNIVDDSAFFRADFFLVA
jgi:hypothetical protein